MPAIELGIHLCLFNIKVVKSTLWVFRNRSAVSRDGVHDCLREVLSDAQEKRLRCPDFKDRILVVVVFFNLTTTSLLITFLGYKLYFHVI